VKGEYVQALGADFVINTRKEDVVERVKAWSGGQGVDVAIDNVGGSELAKTIEAVRPFGIIVAYGFMAGAEATINVREFFFTQKQLRGTIFADPEDLQWGLDQVRAGPGSSRPLTERFRLIRPPKPIGCWRTIR
jgi:NADPH:quinone reductase-like Zn-dependent oxidoreductase